MSRAGDGAPWQGGCPGDPRSPVTGQAGGDAAQCPPQQVRGLLQGHLPARGAHQVPLRARGDTAETRQQGVPAEPPTGLGQTGSPTPPVAWGASGRPPPHKQKCGAGCTGTVLRALRALSPVCPNTPSPRVPPSHPRSPSTGTSHLPPHNPPFPRVPGPPHAKSLSALPALSHGTLAAVPSLLPPRLLFPLPRHPPAKPLRTNTTPSVRRAPLQAPSPRRPQGLPRDPVSPQTWVTRLERSPAAGSA